MDYETIKALADTMRIDVEEGDLPTVKAELDEMLDLLASLKEVNTEGVLPMSFPCDIKNHLREDVETESLSVDAVLQNTAEKKYNYFSMISYVE